MSLNVVALAGHLVTQPKVLEKAGVSVGVSFVLATSERIKDEASPSGYRFLEHTAHVRVMDPDAIPDLADKAAGEPVCVVGSFFVHEWEVEGEKRRAFYVRADQWGNSLNVAVIAGNCGADAEVAEMGQTGRSKARVRLATELYVRDPITGEGDKQTHWVGGACYWQAKLQAIAQYFKKGARMAIQGRYIEETYDKDGKPTTHAFVKFDQFDFGAKGGGGLNVDGQPPTLGNDGPVSDFDDEIPF